MRVRVTAKIKINITPDIIQTIKCYSKALNYCIKIGWRRKIKNNVKLHYIVYYDLRNKFKLPSQLAVACIKQACGILKKTNTKPIIKKTCIRYNFPRSANLKGNLLVVRTINKREKFIIDIPNCYKEYFSSWGIHESLLKVDKKGNCFFLFVFSKEIQTISSDSHTRVLGLDFGINKLIVTSDRQFFKSNKVKQIKNKFFYLRKVLQAKGTRSAKRLLKKISGRETRFMAWYNHNISKRIISKLHLGDVIVMENLKGITNVNKGRYFNRWLHNWSFLQLQKFITYKSIRKGIKIIKVNPKETSKRCSQCNSIHSKRHLGFFECLDCGFHLDSDLNASYNIVQLYKRNMDKASVTMPYSRAENNSLNIT